VVQSIEINNVPEVTGIHKNRTNNMSDDRSPPRFLTKMNKSVQPGDQEMAHDDSAERNLRNRNKKPLLKIKLSAKKLQVVDDVDNVNKIKSKSHKVQNSRFESGSPVPDDGSEPADVEPSAEFEVIDDVDEKQTFHCQYCGISCITLLDLNDHYENFHSNTPLLACSVCKQLFQKQSHMKAHMRWKHGMVYKPSKEIFKYLCDLCGSNFRRVSNLKRHYLTNHPDSKPYVCEVCRKCFRLFHQLKIHLRIHTKERPYQCQYCPKTFRTISNRQIHHHTHAAKKPYECTTCSKGFAAKVNWKIHMKKKHNING
jgi:DNA-directed RNA polymerase subunit RPC12/RpoP